MTPTPVPETVQQIIQSGVPVSEASILQIIALIAGLFTVVGTILTLLIRGMLNNVAKAQAAALKQNDADIKQREINEAMALKMRVSDHDQLAEAAKQNLIQMTRMDDKMSRVEKANDSLHESQLQTMRDHATLMRDFGAVQADLSHERQSRAEDKAAYEARIVAKDARFAADITALKADNATAIADVKRESDKDILRMQTRMDDLVREHARADAASQQRITVLESQHAVTKTVADRRGESITRNVEAASAAVGEGKKGQEVIDKAIASAAPGDPPPPPSQSKPSTTEDPANKKGAN